MKKSDEIRRKTWRMIAKNLIVLAALAVAAVIGVMSWFTKSTTAKASNLSITTETPFCFDIAVVPPGSQAPSVTNDSLWSPSVDLNDAAYTFLDTSSYCEITSDGINYFCKPWLTQQGYVVAPDSSKEWDNATANTDYLKFDLYFRSNSPTTMKLTSNTTVYPHENLTSGTNYKQDSVVGAVRMSVNDSSGANKLLWIPAPHVYFDYDQSSVFLNKEPGNAENTYVHTYVTRIADQENPGEFVNQRVTSSNTIANNQKNYKLGQDVAVVQITDADKVNGTQYYVNHITVNLWIEGEDAEARLAMVDGQFDMRLYLAADNN